MDEPRDLPWRPSASAINAGQEIRDEADSVSIDPMDDDHVRAALQRHWAASDADDFVMEHEVYAEDAVLEYPQSRERIRGRHDIQASRMAQPDKKRFAFRRILGSQGVWVSELVVTYGERPFQVGSVMEFEGGKVARETRYFGEPFEPGASRRQWTESMD